MQSIGSRTAKQFSRIGRHVKMSKELNAACPWPLLCCLLFATNAMAWVAQGFYSDPANPGMCTYSTLVLSPGESAQPPGECVRIYCMDEMGLVSVHGCMAIAPPPNCVWGDIVDEHAPYPECCARHYRCNLPVQPSNETLSEAGAYAENVRNMLRSAVVQSQADVMAASK